MKELTNIETKSVSGGNKLNSDQEYAQGSVKEYVKEIRDILATVVYVIDAMQQFDEIYTDRLNHFKKPSPTDCKPNELGNYLRK
jgi:hypothetical protein